MSIRDLIESGDIGNLAKEAVSGIMTPGDTAFKLGRTIGENINIPAAAKSFGLGALKGFSDLPIAGAELAFNAGASGGTAGNPYPNFAPPREGYEKIPRPFDNAYDAAIEEGGTAAQVAGIAGGLAGGLGLGMTSVGKTFFLSALDNKITKAADTLFANPSVGKNLLTNTLRLTARTGGRAAAIGGVNVIADTPYNLSESTDEKGNIDFDKFAELEKNSAIWGTITGAGITIADPNIRKAAGELGSDVIGKLFKNKKEATGKLLEIGMQQSQAAIKKSDMEMQKALDFEAEIDKQKTQELESQARQIEGNSNVVPVEKALENKNMVMNLMDSDLQQQSLLKEFDKNRGPTKKITGLGDELTSKKSGFQKSVDYGIQPTISAANDMSQKMGTDLVQYAWAKERLPQIYKPRLERRIELAKKVFKDPAEAQRWSDALQNSDAAEREAMFKLAEERGYPELREVTKETDKMFSDILDLKEAATGIKFSRRELYNPRSVNFKKFFKDRQAKQLKEQLAESVAERETQLGKKLSRKEVKTIEKKLKKTLTTEEDLFHQRVEKAIQKAEDDKGQKLSFEEINDIKARMFDIPKVGPTKSKFGKQRTREIVKEDIRPFMKNADDSALEYLEAEAKDIAIARFFRDTPRISNQDIAKRIGKLKSNPEVDIFKARKEKLMGEGYDESIADMMTDDWIKDQAINQLKAEKQGKTYYDSYVKRLIHDGDLNAEDEANAVKLLENVFSNMNKPMTTHGKIIRDSAFFTLMSQLDVATIQLADYGTSLARQSDASPLDHIKSIADSIAKKSEIPLEQMGLEKKLLEFGDPNNKAGYAKEMLGLPLSTLDSFMKQANTNTAYKGYSKMAKKLMKELTPEQLDDLVQNGNGAPILRALEDISPQYKMLFRNHMRNMEPARFRQLLEDLNGNKITDVTREFLFNDLANTQPIRDIDMPQGYMENKKFLGMDTRLAYTLKSFGLKRLDMWRQEVVRDFARAETKTQKARAAQRLAGYLAWMGSFEVGIRAGREIVRGNEPGEDFNINDLAVNFMLNQVGFDKYSVDNIRREGFGGVAKMAAPPTNLPVDIIDDVAHAEEVLGGERVPKLLRNIPFLGRFLYGKAKKGDLEMSGDRRTGRTRTSRPRTNRTRSDRRR